MRELEVFTELQTKYVLNAGNKFLNKDKGLCHSIPFIPQSIQDTILSFVYAF